MAKTNYLRVSFAVTPSELVTLLAAATKTPGCKEPNAEGKYAYIVAITNAKRATTQHKKARK